MKRSLLILGLVILAGSFSSCKKYKNKEVYANVPIYQDYDSFRNSFEFQEGKLMENAGNIYVHDNFVLVNDIDKGIHIYNNMDPMAPYSIGFLNIPGNTQMAMDNNMLYADSFIDLLAIDMSNMNNPQLVKRLPDVFSYSLPMISEGYPVADIQTDKGVVIGWTIEKTKEVSGFMKKINVSDCDGCNQTEVETKSMVSANVNLAGSMSQFAIIENFLYSLDVTDIKSFDLSSPSQPKFGGTVRTWAEPETLFPEGDLLYVGTTTGMMIYSTGANEKFPNLVSEIEHVRSCDPVVVSGDYAYLTLRSGSDCAGDINEYQVIDVSNMYAPDHKQSHNMYDPHGLAVDNDLLFICDGADGLKIFNLANNPLGSGSPLYHFPNIQTSDIILNNGNAIMIAKDGVYQYNYTDPSNIYLLSEFHF